MREILDTVLEALERGERLALISSVRSVGSTPRHHSARLAVWPDGRTVGTIGGGTMELQAVADAQDVLAEGQPRLIEYNLIGREPGNVGLCGGTQEVFIELLTRQTSLQSDMPSDGGGMTYPAAASGSRNDYLQTFRAVRQAVGTGEAVVVATVVKAEGLPDLLGATQILWRTGQVQGSLGDNALEAAVQALMPRVLAEGYPTRLGFDPATGEGHRLMSTRHAPVEVFLDVINPSPRLLIIGAGHIGAALARLGKFMGWWVGVVDDRPDFITPERLPDVDAIYPVVYDPQTEHLAPMNLVVTPNMAVVIATWGWDEPVLRQLAGAPAYYMGLVSSLRKATIIFDALRAEGIDTAWLEKIRVPVGLDLGAESPEEIALSIMAEAIATARRKSGRPLAEVRGQRMPSLNGREKRTVWTNEPTPT